MSDDAFCPHCRGLLRQAAPHPYPSTPQRCPSCLLLVSAGRSCTAAGQRRLPRAVDAARSAAAASRGGRPGPVPAGPPVDVVQELMRELVHAHRSAL